MTVQQACSRLLRAARKLETPAIILCVARTPGDGLSIHHVRRLTPMSFAATMEPPTPPPPPVRRAMSARPCWHCRSVASDAHRRRRRCRRRRRARAWSGVPALRLVGGEFNVRQRRGNSDARCFEQMAGNVCAQGPRATSICIVPVGKRSVKFGTIL